jgi:Ca-activated chloride channel family protein
MFQDFHFLKPWWLVALIPLIALLVWMIRQRLMHNPWRNVIDPQLLRALESPQSPHASLQIHLPVMLLACGWLITVIALANPTFERQSLPTFRNMAARVLVLDLSKSMLVNDLMPSRLGRARYKMIDILKHQQEGQTALVVFSGAAFVVSPLTDDTKTILALLEALQPQIMPSTGSRPDLGLQQAQALLQQAHVQQGEVVLLTDDAGDERAIQAAQQLAAAGYHFALIGVGTTQGGIIPGVQTSAGAVESTLDHQALQALAQAGQGRYAQITVDDRDLNSVLTPLAANAAYQQQKGQSFTEAWQELGPWIVLAIIPFAALGFRRGWLLPVLILCVGSSVIMPIHSAHAGLWRDLWQRPDQQAATALANQAPEQALAITTHTQQRGAAQYRLGHYEDAAREFALGTTAVDHYNYGTALAKAGHLEKARAALEQALLQDPTFENARYNLAQVEKALADAESQSSDTPSAQSSEEQASSSQNNQPSSPPDPTSDSHSSSSSDSMTASSSSSTDAASATNEQQTQAAKTEDASSSTPSESNAASATQSSMAQTHHESTANPVNADQEGQLAPADVEQAAQDYSAQANARQQAAAADSSAQDRQSGDQVVSQQPASQLLKESETRQAMEQWLRRIPDDPGELLRRKFLYQYRQRPNVQSLTQDQLPW